MILLDLFSGYGGFHLGLEQAGLQFSKTYFSEIDKHAIANYRYNFPNSEYLGAVENVLASGVRANIVTFGSPCQDFSLAGKRAGLKGGRSSLIEYAIEYIRRARPAVFIWENVKGAFSSAGGADFWAIVQAFANIGGYRLQWQLVNTVWWLPQNRERIFLVGLAGNGSGCEIFPIGQSDGGINEGLSEATTVRTLTAGGHSGGHSGGHHSGMTLISDRGLGRTIRAHEDGNAPALSSRNGCSHDIKLIKYSTSQDQKLSPLNGVAQTLNSGHYNVPKIIQRSRGYNKGGEHSDAHSSTLNSSDGGLGVSTGLYEVGSSIRRLTHTECERLQGLPDGWTKYGNYNGVVKEISNTQRYKLCGNGVSIPPVKAIGEKILNSIN